MKHLIGLFITALMFSPAAHAKTIQLLAKDCRQATEAEIPRNDPDWKPDYWPYAEICLLHGPDGQTPVRLLGLPDDAFTDARGVTHTHPKFVPELLPTILLDAHGHRVGDVSGGLPTDFVGETQLFFSDWRHGFPWHIRIHMVNDAVSGNHDNPPLEWDPVAQHYDPFIVLEERYCSSLSSGSLHLPRELNWPSVYEKYTDNCPVSTPDGGEAMSILIFRSDKAKLIGFFRHKRNNAMPPLPVILDEHWLPIGQIPHPFPDSDAGPPQIVFSDWRNNFPWRINVSSRGNAGHPAFDGPPLVWDPVGKHYVVATSASPLSFSVPAIGPQPAPISK